MQRGEIELSVERISDNVFSIGVMNPALRVFDIVMESKYGTTYNSYFISDKKTVVVETVHSRFYDEFLYNLGQLTDIGDIDYLIMNHTEPDHSGSVLKLLEASPNITIVSTMAGKKYLEGMLNRTFNSIVIKDGDTLNIGKTTLKFRVAPLLHWPDSMMTYHPEDKVLFSCDFFGAHYCEPRMFDSCVKYPEKYLKEFEYYYQGIFGPFKPYVLAGIEKIKDFELEYIATSHGPVLTESINDRIEDYRRWSTPVEKEEKSVAVFYASAYGYTKMLAEKAAEAIKKSGIKCELIDIVETELTTVVNAAEEADAIMLGSCTINRDAPKVVWDVLASIDAINTKMRPVVSFGSYGWSGEAPNMVQERLKQLKFAPVCDAVRVNFMPNENDYAEIEKSAELIIEKLKN